MSFVIHKLQKTAVGAGEERRITRLSLIIFYNILRVWFGRYLHLMLRWVLLTYSYWRVLLSFFFDILFDSLNVYSASFHMFSLCPSSEFFAASITVYNNWLNKNQAWKLYCMSPKLWVLYSILFCFCLVCLEPTTVYI